LTKERSLAIPIFFSNGLMRKLLQRWPIAITTG
jgi:hypothetical protein